MKLKGSEIIVECLKEQGVDTVFGYPGGMILDVYDALYKHPEIRHILTAHEQGAAHAADGYARATGKAGVCMATSGPGATNLVTGIATAYMDSVPMVAITANVSVNRLGQDAFQEVDIAGIVTPVTKYSMIVKDVSLLADAIRRAFRIALSGRRGPVLVDVTRDVTQAGYEYTRKRPERSRSESRQFREEDIAKAAELINGSKRPFLFVGGGCVSSGAASEVRMLQRKLDAGVCDSLMGKGVFPGNDPLYTGMLGMHGTKTANLCVYECDLLIVLGARFSDRCVGSAGHFAEQAKILQIDVDPAEINKNVIVDRSITGDVKEVLKALLPLIDERTDPSWKNGILKMKKQYPLKYEKGRLTGPAVIEEIDRQTRGRAVIATDVGQHQMWASQYYIYKKPRTLITSGGLGTMGFGLGAAIGAKIGCPEKTVVHITGDGCFRMNMNELATASSSGTPVIVVLFNNHALGMVRQWQTFFYGGRYSQTLLEDNADYLLAAKAFGVPGERVSTNGEFADAFSRALKADGPYLIECGIASEDAVMPMIPAGAANDEVIDSSDL